MLAGRSPAEPVLGQRFGWKSGQKLLVVSFYDPNGLLTIRESIAALQRMSRHTIDVANLWPGGGDWLALPETFDLREYDGIIIHPTVSYNPGNIAQIDRKMSLKLRDYRGVKVLMKQDEQFRAGQLAPLIEDKRFDLVVTCLAASEWEKVYPRDKIGDCRILQSLTGFVSPEMRSNWRKPVAGRTIDVGYRGSLQPLAFGRLGFEKWEIGHKFLKEVARIGIPLRCDVSSRWEDRLSGQEWIAFLQNSRTTLGVESGSNLFDFDGQVEQKCLRFAAENQHIDPWSHEYYWKAHQEFLHEYEGNVLYNQISPRHLEASAAGSVQVLYEGEYSGIFKPWQHYIPLKKDFSNFAEVTEAIQDDNLLHETALRAYEEIVLNRRYTYEKFVSDLDEVIGEIAGEKGPARKGASGSRSRIRSDRPVIFVLVSHDPVLDPRIEWWADKLIETFTVVEIGSCRAGSAKTGLEIVSEHRLRIRVDPDKNADSWFRFVDHNGMVDQNVGLTVLKNLLLARAMQGESLTSRLGLFAGPDERERFRGHLDFFIATNAGLIEASQQLGRPAAVLSCDLDTLPAGVALTKDWGIPLVYDAHEFWPYSFPYFTAGQSSFWAGVERTLVPHTDIRISVSPQLASLMTEAYGYHFESVPNAVPKRHARGDGGRTEPRIHPGRVEFLYQGIFAPTRGIERLIRAWTQVVPEAVLVLRGPESTFKDEMRHLAASEGLSDERVLFDDPVSEDQLVQAAGRSDIGVIPYESANINNKFCCPNKLSQYLAAGLPILANRTDFVRSVVAESESGLCLDFADEHALADAINELARNDARRKVMADNAMKYFSHKFNWDIVSAGVVASIKAQVSQERTFASELDLSWLKEPRLAAPYLERDDIAKHGEGKRPQSVVDHFFSGFREQLAQQEHMERLLQEEIVRLQNGIDELQETVSEMSRISAAYDDLNMRPSQLARRLSRLVISEVLRRSGLRRRNS
jgi:Glycosyltransferase